MLRLTTSVSKGFYVKNDTRSKALILCEVLTAMSSGPRTGGGDGPHPLLYKHEATCPVAHASPRALSACSQPSNSQITHFKTGLEDWKAISGAHMTYCLSTNYRFSNHNYHVSN